MSRAARQLESSPAMNEGLLEFGPYRLDVRRRLLLKGHRHVRVTSRALSILVVLAERAGQLVSKRELQALVWPNAVIEDGTLRVHVAALRKMLGETPDGLQLVQNIPGQGYRLAVPVRGLHSGAEAGGSSDQSAVAAPLALSSMDLMSGGPLIGRNSCIQQIVTTLYERRLVTITGPGGIGKTAVAQGVVEAIAADYVDRVWVVDLAAVQASHEVTAAVAERLGAAAADVSAILVFLQEAPAVLVLDNCEEVLDGAAALAQAVLNMAPSTRVLATSREQLHLQGERVYRLGPLQVAPEGVHTREALLGCAAIALFLRRAAIATDIELGDEDLQRVAQLCRRLEGNPLAIEIAAARLDLLGLQGLMALFDQGHHLSIVGPRGQTSRYRTLRGLLDSSYDPLSALQRTIFRRLGVFRAHFDLDAAVAVVSAGELGADAVFEALLSLTCKSLLGCESRDGRILFWLPETSRLYALGKLRECDEYGLARNQHAVWASGRGARRSVEDARDAIDWCFTAGMNLPAAARVGLFVAWLDLLATAEKNVGNDAQLLELAHRESPLAEHGLRELRVAMRTGEPLSAPAVLSLAQQIGTTQVESEKVALWRVWFEQVLQRQARLAMEISTGAAQPDRAVASTDAVLALAHFYAGDLSRARWHAERGLTVDEGHYELGAGRRLQCAQLRIILARTLWLQGLPESAMAAACTAVKDAQAGGDAQMLGLCQVSALVLAMAIKVQEGSLLMDLVRRHASGPGMELVQLWVVCLEGVLASRADTPVGSAVAEALEGAQSLDVLGALREEWMSADAIIRAEQGLGGWLTAEALRVKAERLLQAGNLDAAAEADELLRRAAGIAQAQGALFWEHRVAMSQARLLQRQSQVGAARELLIRMRARFSEGLRTSDLLKSEALLHELKLASDEESPRDVLPGADGGCVCSNFNGER